MPISLVLSECARLVVSGVDDPLAVSRGGTLWKISRIRSMTAEKVMEPVTTMCIVRLSR